MSSFCAARMDFRTCAEKESRLLGDMAWPSDTRAERGGEEHGRLELPTKLCPSSPPAPAPPHPFPARTNIVCSVTSAVRKPRMKPLPTPSSSAMTVLWRSESRFPATRRSRPSKHSLGQRWGSALCGNALMKAAFPASPVNPCQVTSLSAARFSSWETQDTTDSAWGCVCLTPRKLLQV